MFRIPGFMSVVFRLYEGSFATFTKAVQSFARASQSFADRMHSFV